MSFEDEENIIDEQEDNDENNYIDY